MGVATAAIRAVQGSLRAKLILVVLLVEVVALALLIGNSVRLTDQFATTAMVAREKEIRPLLTAALARPLFQRDVATIGEILRDIVSEHGITSVVLTDSLGLELARIVAPGASADAPTRPNDVILIEPVVLGGVAIGEAEIRLSTSLLRMARASELAQGLTIAGAELAVSLVVFGAFGLLLTRRLNRLSRAATGIAAGSPLAWPRIGGHDEVARIADAFRRTLDALFSTIREQRSAEEAARDNEARLRSVVESLPFDVWVRDTDGRCTMQNASALAHWGDRRGQTLSDRGLPDDILDAWTAADQRALKGEVVEDETALPRDDGERIVLRVVGPVRNASGIAGTVAMTLDVTDHRRAERALRTSQQLLQAFIDHLPHSVVIKGMDGRYAAVSPSYARLFGREADELVGHSVAELFAKRDAEQIQAFDERVLSKRQARREVVETNLNGKARFFDVTKFPLFDSGRVTGLAALAVEITEQRRMQEELLHARKMESIGRLTGGIAHDFNNLLAVILGNIELLEEALTDDATACKHVVALKRNVDRGTRLTRGLLTFARRQTLKPRSVDVNQVVRDLSEMLKHLFGDPIATRLDLAVNVQPVMVDAAELENTLLNMAINARDAMPDGGVLTISTAQLPPQGSIDACPRVAISLADTGYGMSDEVRTRATEPFFTTKPAGHGTGLGLSAAFGFAAQSGGRLEIDSAVGRGTTITIVLPAADAIVIEGAAAVSASF